MSDITETKAERTQRFIKLAVVGVVTLVVAALIFNVLHSVGTTKRKPAPMPTMIALLPPPPPPPPEPPKEKPPEPEKMQEVSKPDPTPAPAPPQQITINGPAQAGTDAFGVQAGSGGGTTALGATTAPPVGEGGLGEGFYNRYLSSSLQQAMQADERINRLVFRADVAVWIDSVGRITRASILKTSGDPKVDHTLVSALQQVAALDEPPPASVKFPQRVTIRGRKGA